jgi:hypothetical protein
MPACKEIAMADPEEDRMQSEGALPDGRPRRAPPIIEGEAVEISPDGSPAWGGIRTLLSHRKAAAGVAAAAVAFIIIGASWIYLASDGGGARPQTAAGPEPVASSNAAGSAAGATAPETAARTAAPSGTAAAADKTADTRELESRLESRLAAVDATLATLNERVAALDRIVRDATAAARAAAERAEKSARLLEEARKNGDEQEAAQQIDRSAMDELGSRIKALESRQMTLRQVQEKLDRLASTAGAPDKDVRLALAAAALRNGVERDRPFAEELAAARKLGLDDGALAALEPFAATGLPRRNELFRELSALLSGLRRVSAPASQDQGYLDRLQASAARMLNIRPVKDEPGDEPATVLSRIEVRMVQQDIDIGGIVAELDKLPAPAKELAKAWRTRALARREAIEAARSMAAGSLAKLGEAATSGSSPQ